MAAAAEAPLAKAAVAELGEQWPFIVRIDYEGEEAGCYEARFEAGRCLSCGNCFECDNCFAACPEQAILRLGRGRGYRVEPDLCTGCGICFEQCPCHAIEMQPEPVPAEAPLGPTAEPLAPHRFRLRV